MPLALCGLTAIRLDHYHLTSVQQIGVDVVERLDVGHGGIEALGEKPKRVASLHPVTDGRSSSGQGLALGYYSLAAEGNLQALACPDPACTAKVICVYYSPH